MRMRCAGNDARTKHCSTLLQINLVAFWMLHVGRLNLATQPGGILGGLSRVFRRARYRRRSLFAAPMENPLQQLLVRVAILYQVHVLVQKLVHFGLGKLGRWRA